MLLFLNQTQTNGGDAMEDNNSAKTNNIRLTIVVVTSIAIAATLICIILLLLFRAGNSRKFCKLYCSRYHQSCYFQNEL